MREIQYYMKEIGFLLTKVSFQRLARDVAQNISADLRFQSSAVLALQEAAECYLVSFLEGIVFILIYIPIN